MMITRTPVKVLWQTPLLSESPQTVGVYIYICNEHLLNQTTLKPKS